MNLQRSKHFILTLVCAGCAVLPGVWLYHNAQPRVLTLHHEITDTIKQLNAVDVRWNEDILKSRLGLNRNYDPLVQATTAQAALVQQLSRTLQSVASDQEAVFFALQTYQDALRDKADLVEQFKSQNSIFRNSSSFISLSLHNLLEALHEQQARSEVAIDALETLKPYIHNLLLGVLEYMSKPQDHTVGFILQQTEALQTLNSPGAFPESLSSILDISLNHVHILLQKEPLLKTLLTEILAFPTSTYLDTLRHTYTLFYERHRTQGERYQTLLFASSAAIVILCTFLGLRWRSRHRIQLLTGMREQLTRELSKTYEELKQSQIRLIQSEKMSALGQMIAGVAHEINTPLAYSRSNVALVHEQLPSLTTLLEEAIRQAELLDAPERDEAALSQQTATVAELARSLRQEDIATEISELLQASLSGLSQISEMVMNLKDFSRLDRKKVDKVNLNAGLDSALMIAQNTLKNKVAVVKKYGDIPAITCAPSQINQVFLNMLVNASQAMADHGMITLTTRATDTHVEVCIEDDGKGIPDDVLPHIFDPFFTTKEVGEGTGLGLAISYQIIEQHGGSISVQSEVGRGTCFTIALPIKPQLDAALTSEEAH